MSTPTFEERYTAWIDGRLAGHELAAFERELDAQDRSAADADRTEALQLRTLLQSHSAPPMPNPERFHEQLLARMMADAQPTPLPAQERPAVSPWPRLAWAAGFCLLVGLSAYNFTRQPGSPAASLSQATPTLVLPSEVRILEVEPKAPNIYATAIHSEQDNLTVLWLDGLDYLPASYQLK